MRIRKHAKLSSLLYATSSSTALQPHVCQLNQSPWDVMPLSPTSTPLSAPPPPPPPPSQVNNENVTSAINCSSQDSISVAKWEEDYHDDNVDGRRWDSAGKSHEGPLVVLCSKTNGMNWQCGRDAIKGNSISMCDHHLSLARDYSTAAQSSNMKKKAVVVAEAPKHRARPKKASSGSTSSNPYEFYYYSGFGPRWGKKRGVHKDNGSSNVNVTKISHENDVVKPATSFHFIDRDLDYTEDDDDDEEVLYERKRARKPVKARSLKSLM